MCAPASLKAARQVYCAFILDRDILDALPRADRRVEFILGALQVLDEDLRRLGGALIVRHGFAADELPRLAAELRVQAVFANHDDEPQALQRDARVAERLVPSLGLEMLRGFRVLLLPSFESGQCELLVGRVRDHQQRHARAWRLRLRGALRA